MRKEKKKKKKPSFYFHIVRRISSSRKERSLFPLLCGNCFRQYSMGNNYKIVYATQFQKDEKEGWKDKRFKIRENYYTYKNIDIISNASGGKNVEFAKKKKKIKTVIRKKRRRDQKREKGEPVLKQGK